MGEPSGIAAALTLIEAARAAGRRSLAEPDAKAFLAALGIPSPKREFIYASAAAPAAAGRVGLPVAAKLVAAEIAHKSDVGGVVCPIATAADAEAACTAIAERLGRHRPGAKPDGFLIEQYRPAAVEWILGWRADPSFGPVVMFGLGGVHVETLRQVSFRLAPLNDAEIDALIRDRPAMRLLDGARGAPPADRAALTRSIASLAALADEPRIVATVAEIEINPLSVGPAGVLALDALVVLR